MGTLVCRIELSKENGIKLNVENKDGKITQTVVMDGTLIKITNKGDGEDNTSVITQKTDGIGIKCKTFTLEAETVTIKSKGETKHTSEKTFAIDSTKAMTIKSKDAITIKATKELGGSGSKVTMKGQQAAELSATNVAVKGSAKAEIKGAQVAIKGSAKTEVAGAMVDLKADAMMNVKGQMTTVEGQMTMIKGSLVKLG